MPIDRVVARGWLSCKEEAEWGRTWRVRRAFLLDARPRGTPVDVGRGGLLLARSVADVHYRERVSGLIEVHRDARGRETLRSHRFDHLATSFPTRALLLHLPPEQERSALRSLAQALRHVLPVHLGIDADDMEVLPLFGEPLGGRFVDGLAFVDLYPGGVGLVDAVADDTAFLLGLLDAAQRWLEGCPCASETGCARCLRSPAAQALSGDSEPSRGAALDLLSSIVP